ncbi:crosslink repair DNA glycosylase YcaQ family protein [Nonomuraea sp. NPDC003804]|uniref:winged helix-turn-helix domain-containing protein n=1 Tax=Nonomuraea sp. NPDC003804 TaxID=3154547 RepID=UPI0033A7F4E5
MTELSADDARRLILRAQGFLGAEGRRGGVQGMLRRLGAVQLDTVSVLARSHELVAYGRLGAVGRTTVERAYWHNPARSFEYWCHAACILPIEHWPLYGFRRRAYRARRQRWHEVPADYEKVLHQVRDSGPVTTSDIGGAKKSAEWWDWSDSKIALEWLLDIGELVCTRRVGWRRVYDLAERAVPADLLGQELTDEECVVRLAAVAGASLGVATRADLIDFLRLRGSYAALLDQALADGAAGLVPVKVAGWAPNGQAADAWASPEVLASEPRGRHRTTLVSPFDSLIWHRGRTSRVFGFDYTLELYVPKAKRVHGYFTMPVLSGGKLIARVDPAREGQTFVARHVSFESPRVRPADLAGVREALWSAASWVGCTDVRVERVTSEAHAKPLLDALPLALPDLR